MTNSSLNSEERESEEVVVDDIQQGIPQIPIDLFVKKNRKGVRFFDAFGNLRYKVGDASPLSPHNHGLRGRVLLDSSGNPVVSIYRSNVSLSLSLSSSIRDKIVGLFEFLQYD